MHSDTLQSIEVPLKQLIDSLDNVRTTAADEGIEELAASITAVGLLQSIVVRKQPRGKFAVVAGRRRLLALSQLAANGTLKANWPVPCRLADTDADPTELSLTENVMCVPMHPADEFVAFQKLIATGKCVADVAARFGVSEAVVNGRLALARVSPALFELYREGVLNLDMLKAFTLSDDHAQQEQLWASLQQWERKAHIIRQRLSQNSIPATDKCVRFVGLEQYEAAGGLLKRDLFAEADEGIQILDPAKLNRLAAEKLQALAEQVRTEGWKWVEVQPETDHAALGKMRRILAPMAELPAKQQAKLDKLIERGEALDAQLSESDDEGSETIYARIEEINKAIDAIERTRTQAYPDDIKAICGVAIGIDQLGEPAYTYGLIRREDERSLPASRPSGDASFTPSDNTVAAAGKEDEPSSYSASLIETLTMHKTAAIAVELARNPQTALAALVHALVLRTFGLDLGLYRSETCLQISANQPYLEDVKDSPARIELDRQRKQWLDILPRETSALSEWCFSQEEGVLLHLLAFLTASSLNAVQSVRTAAAESDGRARREQADQLAARIKVDPALWFRPTVENFYGKVSKAQILTALEEAGKSVPDAAKLKKAELAQKAEKELEGTGWLPAPLRIREMGNEINSTGNE